MSCAARRCCRGGAQEAEYLMAPRHRAGACGRARGARWRGATRLLSAGVKCASTCKELCKNRYAGVVIADDY